MNAFGRITVRPVNPLAVLIKHYSALCSTFTIAYFASHPLPPINSVQSTPNNFVDQIIEPTHKRKHKRRPKVVLMPLPVLRSASRKHHARDAQPSQEASGTQEIEMEGLEHEALQKDDKAQYKSEALHQAKHERL